MAALLNEMKALRAEVEDLRQRNALHEVVDSGLSAINDKLAPLSSLLRHGEKLNDQEAATLAAIRATLKSPDYSTMETGLLIIPPRKIPATKGGKS